MLFVVIGRDAKDAGALDRRMAARPAHVALIEEMQPKGQTLLGLALMGEDGKMNGSVMVLDLPDRAALDAWLAKEPYVTGKVWETVDVSACQPGPPFVKTLETIRKMAA